MAPSPGASQDYQGLKNTQMTTFRITNIVSGMIFGEYEGITPTDALDALARDAGYADYAAASDVVPAKDDEILVEATAGVCLSA